MNRPKHIDRALETLREVALTHKSTLTCGDLMEVSHYVARLERQLKIAKDTTRLWPRIKVWWTKPIVVFRFVRKEDR